MVPAEIITRPPQELRRILLSSAAMWAAPVAAAEAAMGPS
jgi:hypothetical protein